MNNENLTKDWQLWQSGVKYNNQIKPNYYDTVNANIDMFAGNQWRNAETSQLMKPVFNIIKRITTFFVASLTSSKSAVQFEPLAYSEGQITDEMTAAEFAGAEVENLFEKLNMDNRIRDGLFQAAVKGDVAAHFYFDPTKKPYRGAMSKMMGLPEEIKGEICFELVSGTNVFFGNANNPDVDVQPYIIISGRDTVQNLRDEAKLYKTKVTDEIKSDHDYNYESGEAGQIEVETDEYGKALYIIKYYKDKESGTVKASKSVKNTYIYENVDTGLECYPISWLCWEKQESQYHGRALITGIIPNQIFINKMFAMVMYNLMMTAFPKAVYNTDYIDHFTNEIGLAIPVTNLAPGENIKNVAGYLETGNMSAQITSVIDMAMSYTKETLGISDVAMGNVNPTNTSAIIAVQKSTVIPLENPRANMHEWLEDIGRILIDMMGTKYGYRPVVRKHDMNRSIEMFDFSVFKDLWLSVKVDVGEASYWSEVATLQTLDNLLMNGMIEIVDYLERLPEGHIPKKQELINSIKERMQMQPQGGMDEAMLAQMEQFVASLPQDIQQQLQQLPDNEMIQQVQQMMSQQQ